MLSSVDLPQPLGPMMATISFWAIVRVISRTASTSSSCFRKVFDTWRRSIMTASLEDRPLMAAVDVDIGACDKRGTLRSEEGNRFGDIFGRSPAAERHLRAPSAFLLFEAASVIDLVVQREVFSKRAPDAARQNRVDGDAVGGKLVGQRFHESMLGGVDPRRSDGTGLRHFPSLTDDDNKPTASASPHPWHHAAGQLPGTQHLGPEMTLQRFTRDLIETAGQMCSCIAHDDVDAAEGLTDVIDQGCGVRWLADIGNKALDPGRTNGRYGAVKLSLVTAANADATTFCRQGPCDGQPDAAGATRDQRDPVGQTDRHVVSPEYIAMIAAVDADGAARNETGAIRNQKGDQIGDFFRLPGATERIGPGEACRRRRPIDATLAHLFLDQRNQQFGFDILRTYRIDANVVARHRIRHRLAH